MGFCHEPSAAGGLQQRGITPCKVRTASEAGEGRQLRIIQRLRLSTWVGWGEEGRVEAERGGLGAEEKVAVVMGAAGGLGEARGALEGLVAPAEMGCNRDGNCLQRLHA